MLWFSKSVSNGSFTALQFLLICWGAISTNGCKKTSTAQSASVIEDIALQEREFARSVLLKANQSDEIPTFDLTDLLKRGEIESLPATSDFNATESLYSSINAMQQYSVGSQVNEAGNLTRMETFVFRDGLSPGQIRFQEKTLPFQLSVSANAEIRVIRTFRDTAEAQRVPPFSLVHLPIDETNALQMRVGDLFVIPLESQLTTAVDGSFIMSAARAGAPLLKLLGSSMNAHSGSGLRANLVVSGRFEMHIFKTARNTVRVRFFEQSGRTVSGGGTASASAGLKYTVLPLSKLHTVRELKKIKRINFYGSPELQLSDALKENLNKSVLSAEDRKFSEVLDVPANNDGMVEMANKITLTAEKIQQMTTDRLNSALVTINDGIIKKINEPIEKLKKYTDQEFAISAAASWEEKRSKKIQFFSEYEFDISQQLGLESYLHAVSGSSVFLGTSSKILNLNRRNQGGHNLVLAERIAKDSLDKADPPVRCLLSVSSRASLSDRHISLNFGRMARFAVSESWNRESYTATLSDGKSPARKTDLVRWSYTHGYKFGIVSDQQTRVAGYATNTDASSNQRAVFWFTRLFDWRGGGGGHLNSFLRAAYNTLGPVAGSLRLNTLYQGEVSGPMKGRMRIALSHSALKRIFNQENTPSERVWAAVAKVSETFDNTFGLPFIMFPMGIPASVSGTLSQKDCETISRVWGSFYCHFLDREFLPALQKAQQGGGAETQTRFFESFLSRGFGANKLGSDLLTRVLIEVLVSSGHLITADDLAVEIEVEQLATRDPAYSPRVSYGNSSLVELLDIFSPVR